VWDNAETQADADVPALTVRTYNMPNDDWQVICQRGWALREAEGMLAGYAAGDDPAPGLDHSAPRPHRAGSGAIGRPAGATGQHRRSP
jgi:hypothetical protein